MEKHNWSYHGVDTTKEQADEWRKIADNGICPWCGKNVGRRYNNVNRHLRDCKSKPKNITAQKIAESQIRNISSYTIAYELRKIAKIII